MPRMVWAYSLQPCQQSKAKKSKSIKVYSQIMASLGSEARNLPVTSPADVEAALSAVAHASCTTLLHPASSAHSRTSSFCI